MSYKKLSDFPQSQERDLLLEYQNQGMKILTGGLGFESAVQYSVEVVTFFGLAKEILELRRRLEKLESK
jgi:hypothetical protein